MPVAKVYTFRVTVWSGREPNPTVSMEGHVDDIPTVAKWKTTVTVNVEADDLEAARDEAVERGEALIDELLPEWNAKAERNRERKMAHVWTTEAPDDRSDVNVTATFEDLVVGTAVMPDG